MSNDGISEVDGLSNRAHGVDKLRGLENAALAHAKHERRRPEEMQPPATVVEIGRLDPPAQTYVPPPVRTDVTPGDIAARREHGIVPRDPPSRMAVADHARVQMNLQVKEQIAAEDSAKGSTLILGENASLKMNVHAKSATGGSDGGLIILEPGASFKLNEHIGHLEGSGGTLMVGQNASVQINVHADQALAGGTLMVSDGENVKANVHIDMVAVAAPRTFASPHAVPTEPVPPKPNSTALDVQKGIQTLSVEALKQPAREDAAVGAKPKDPDSDLDPRWLLFREIVKSMDQKSGQHLAIGHQKQEASHAAGSGDGHVKLRTR